MRIVTFVLAALGSAYTAAAQELPADRPLADEIRCLRIELLQERIERRDERIAGLERQLAAADVERNRIGETQRAHNEEITELEQRLAQPALAPEERAEVARQHSLWTTTGAARVAELNLAASRREAELRAQLAKEQQVRRQLMDTLRALGGTAPTNQ